MQGINFAYAFHESMPPDVKNGMLKIEGRYWSIEDSELVPITDYGVSDPEGTYWIGPKNNSTELGCKLALLF